MRIAPKVVLSDALLERYIDEMMACKLSSASRGVVASSMSGVVSLELSDADGLRWETLKVSDQVLLRKKLQISREEITAQQKGFKVRESILQRLLESDLKSGPEKDAAIFLCRTVSWGDCITTVVTLEGRRYVLSAADPQKPELRISGFLTSEPEINVHADRLRKRLSAETWSSLPEQLQQSIGDILGEYDQPAPEVDKAQKNFGL